MIVPEDSSERAALLRTLARRTVPSFDFFLFSLLAGLTLGVAMLLDSPALYLLAALIAPFMAPALGIAVGTLAGNPRFMLESLASLSIGSLILFLTGAVAGWAAALLPARAYTHAAFYSQFSWPYFLVLGIGSAITAYLLARVPNQKPLVSSVAIAYGLYLPAGAAGFGMTSGALGLWTDGLLLFGVHLLWVVVAALTALAVIGLRPLNLTGTIFSAVYAAAVVVLLVWLLPRAWVTPQAAVTQTLAPETAAPLANNPAELAAATAASATSPALTQTPVPTLAASPANTSTASPTPTRTLVPSRTPTITITPAPTPVFARINASLGDGALVREGPDYTAGVVQSVLNGTLVEVLPEVTTSGSEAWVHIRLVNGKDGWVVRGLLQTATPAPTW